MRILWASNAPWNPSGYGVQTNQVVSRLHRDGHAVAVAANHGLDGTSLVWNGIPVFPKAMDGYGRDAVLPLYERWRRDGNGETPLLLTLFDVWVYSDPAWDPLPIASWVPIDHLQVPPEVLKFAAKHRMIAMSQHGQRALAAAGIRADYVPHAVETSVFRPAPTRAREVLGIPPDAFVVLIVAANKGNQPPRKAWAEMLTAYAAFAQSRPDVYLYLHTEITGLANGINLPTLLQLRGIAPERLRISPQAEMVMGDFTASVLNELYNAAGTNGVFLNTSFGEGFGVPALEAQAAGCPVIVSNVTAQPELCGAGWTTETQVYYDLTQGADYGIPLIDSIVANLEAAYAARGDQALRDRAVSFAAGYDAEVVYQRDWKPLLADLERWMAAPAAPRAQRRAAERAQKKRRAA